MSSRLPWSKKMSVDNMRRIRRKRLNGMAFLVWFGCMGRCFEEVLMFVCGLCMEICFDVVVDEMNLDN